MIFYNYYAILLIKFWRCEIVIVDIAIPITSISKHFSIVTTGDGNGPM